jgi:uncharacterized protein
MLYAILFIIIAVVGLFYVKWNPYYHKTFVAASKHSIGNSIISGKTNIAPRVSWDAAWSYAKAYYTSVWQAAVLGILLGSLVQVLVPKQWLIKVLGKASFGSTAKAGLAAVPAMMCTCCAAPLAVGLRKQNVSVGAALAFWLGNPTINPATLIFMGFVLSWKFTILRLVFGLILVFGVSFLANRFVKDSDLPDTILKAQETQSVTETGSFWSRWLKSAWSLILNIVPAYVIAVLVLGAIRAWLFPSIGEAMANSILTMIGLAIAGMFFVIPTAGEIPIIQTLMKFGLGTGPAAALLITLPSISLPSMLMVAKAFPARVIAFVAASVVVLGIICGIVGMWIL